MRHAALCGLALLLALLAGAARAGDVEDRELVQRLFASSGLEAVWFSDGFLRQVPLAKVGEILEDLRRRYGTPERVGGEAGRFVAWTETHRIPVLLDRDPAGRIATLVFRPAEPLDVNFYQTLHALRALSGEVAYLVRRDHGVMAAHQADEALAVSSAFKLAVLVALRNRIRSGAARWADVIRLEPRHASLPSGFVQDMPPGAPLTLHSLAAAMIAQSDNTAADALIDFLGREAIEAVAGFAPLLTTREAFLLKVDPALYDDYARRNLAGRRALLSGLGGRPLPRLGQVAGIWRAEAEWPMSVRDLCRLMTEAGDLALLRINPGPAAEEDWQSVAYKGGSEPGVLNMTTLVTHENGRRFCVAVTWNDTKALDEPRFTELYRNLLISLRDG